VYMKLYFMYGRPDETDLGKSAFLYVQSKLLLI
jgi:hypothetical protein